MADENKFDLWAVMELFGHQRIAGRVTEQVIAGQGFIRVDVPAVGDQIGFTRIFGPGAIYYIIPTTQEIVVAFVQKSINSPIVIRLPSCSKLTFFECAMKYHKIEKFVSKRSMIEIFNWRDYGQGIY